jgi:hypothetical protein
VIQVVHSSTVILVGIVDLCPSVTNEGLTMHFSSLVTDYLRLITVCASHVRVS